MMNLKTILCSLGLALSSTFSHGASIETCSDTSKYAANSYLVVINDDDASSKADMLAALRLLASGGFSVEAMFAYDFNKDITFYMRFDPTYWLDAQKAEQVRLKVLTDLLKIDGVTYYCDGLVFPAKMR